MLKLTMEEKKKYLEMLHNPNTLPFTPPDGYMDCLNQVNTKEVLVNGSEGQQIRVWIVTPKGQKPGTMAYMNIHGGGFVQPHHIWDSALCAVMAQEFQCTVIDVDYRLAPDYPHPAAVTDCFDVYRWILANKDELGIDEKRIVVGGNSAGGTLTAGVCMKAAEEGCEIPALAVMLYPECGLSTDVDDPDFADHIDLSDVRSRGVLYTLMYIEEESQMEDPYASLLKADEKMLKQFPNTILVTGGQDPLRFDAEEFAKHIVVSGAAIVTKRFLNSKHGFYTRLEGEWQEARGFVFNQIHHFMDR